MDVNGFPETKVSAGKALRALIRIKLLEFISSLGGKKKSSIGGMIGLMIFLALVIAFSLGSVFVVIAIGIDNSGITWPYFSLLGVLTLLLCFIGSVFLTETQMFQAKDNELLLSMPLSPHVILLSRLLSLLVFDYGYALILALPAGIVYQIFIGFDLPALLLFLLSFLTLPLMSMALSMLIAWLFSAISARIKSTRLIRLILSIGACVAYFFFLMREQEGLNQMAEDPEAFIKPLVEAFPPLGWMGRGIVEHDALSFLLYLAACILPFALVSYAVGRNFIHIVLRGEGHRDFHYKSQGSRVTPAFRSMVQLELTRFLSSVGYMINAGMGLIMMIIALVFALLRVDQLQEMVGSLQNMDGFLPAAGCLTILGCLCLTTISAATISLEAKTFWIMRAAPVSSRELLLAKALPHFLVCIPFIVAGATMLQFAGTMSAACRILLYVVPLTASAYNALAGVQANLNHPKFDWKNETQAVKQGFAPLAAMIYNIIPFVLTILLLPVLLLILEQPVSIWALAVELLYLLFTWLAYARLTGKTSDRKLVALKW